MAIIAASQKIYETGLIGRMHNVADDTKSALYKREIFNAESQRSISQMRTSRASAIEFWNQSKTTAV